MPFDIHRIATVKDLIHAAQQCSDTHIPRVSIPLWVLTDLLPGMKARGFQWSVIDAGTRTVVWQFMRLGTTRRRCLMIEVLPLAYWQS